MVLTRFIRRIGLQLPIILRPIVEQIELRLEEVITSSFAALEQLHRHVVLVLAAQLAPLHVEVARQMLTLQMLSSTSLTFCPIISGATCCRWESPRE